MDFPPYHAMTKALTKYDGKKFIIELNSAFGTLDSESKKERLEALIFQLEQYPKSLGDYRVWLN